MKKWICSLMCAVLFMGITACRSTGDIGSAADEAETQTVGTKDYKAGVIDASELIVHDGVAFWGSDQQLCSAQLDENQELYQFQSKGSLSSKVYSLAIDGDQMYIATDEGVVSRSLEDSAHETSIIDEHKLSGRAFQIYDGNIYFTYGTYLIRVPTTGGEEKKLETDIEAFQVTTEGIFCLNSDGDFLLVSLDGTERKTLCELDSEGEIFIQNDTAYITTGDDDDSIFVYELEKDSLGEISFDHTLSPYHPVWVTDEYIYYESEDYVIYQYALDSGTETPIQEDSRYNLPDYYSGQMGNDVLYYVYSANLYWIHLDSGEAMQIDRGEVLGDRTLDSEDSSVSNASTDDLEEAEAATATGDEYNIAEDIGVYNSEGQARLESKYFTLYLPADGDWMYQTVDSTSINIYYEPSYESGNGGLLVSISAYDWSDNRYESFPHYTIAGLSEEKKYVAAFPTVVQYGADEEEGYRKMFDYVQRIDNKAEMADNNPFSCK